MRTRTRSARDVADGSYLASHNRPPAAHMPSAFATIAAEYDALRAREKTTQKAARELRDPSGWRIAETEAKKADARAAAEAVRVGDPAPGTPNLDALAARRRNLDAEAAALINALKLVQNDYYVIVAAEQQNPVYAADLAKARRRLAKIADDLQAAAATAGVALGVHEWVMSSLPYDATTATALGDITTRVDQLAGHSGIGRLPVPIDDLAHTIADLVGQPTPNPEGATP